jgi:hypothetical protein
MIREIADKLAKTVGTTQTVHNAFREIPIPALNACDTLETKEEQSAFNEMLQTVLRNELTHVPAEAGALTIQTIKFSGKLHGDLVNSMICLLGVEKLHGACVELALAHGEEWNPTLEGVKSLEHALESLRIPYKTEWEDCLVFQHVAEYRLWLWTSVLEHQCNSQSNSQCNNQFNSLTLKLQQRGMDSQSLSSFEKVKWMNTREEFLAWTHLLAHEPELALTYELQEEDYISETRSSLAIRSILAQRAPVRRIHDNLAIFSLYPLDDPTFCKNLAQYDKRFIAGPDLKQAADVFRWHPVSKTARMLPNNIESSFKTNMLIVLAMCSVSVTQEWQVIWNTLLAHAHMAHYQPTLSNDEFAKVQSQIIAYADTVDSCTDQLPQPLPTITEHQQIIRLLEPFTMHTLRQDELLLQKRLQRHISLLNPGMMKRMLPATPNVWAMEAQEEQQDVSNDRLKRHLSLLSTPATPAMPLNDEANLDLPFFVNPDVVARLLIK